jgi:hypothetical protein
MDFTHFSLARVSATVLERVSWTKPWILWKTVSYTPVALGILTLIVVVPYFTDTRAKRILQLEASNASLNETVASLKETVASQETTLTYLVKRMDEIRTMKPSYDILKERLQNLHIARKTRNELRTLYQNAHRNSDIIRGHEKAVFAYKKAKDDFTEFMRA